MSVVLTGACGGGSDDGTATTSTTAAVSSTTVITAATGADAVTDLAAVVLTDAPEPLVRAPAPAPQGPFDLTSYLATFSTTEEEDEAFLTTCGFTRGYSRLWFDETGRLVAVFVFECSSPAAATTLRAALEDQDRRLRDGQSFEVTEISGARGGTYLENFDDGKGRVDTVTFVRGPRLYVAGVQAQRLESNRELALEVARRQADVAR
jgi:hypothetical protein